MLPLTLKLRALHDADALPASDDCYSLLRCHGFTVYDRDGRVGTVHDVRFGQATGQPDSLVVRTGLFIRKLILVPTTEIDEISHDKHRVLLRTKPRPVITGLGSRVAARRPRLGGVR